MGRDLFVACMDCRKRYDIGYGPGMTSPEHHATVEALDAEMREHGIDKPNKRFANWRAYLVEHEGHRFVHWSSDYCYIDDKGDLRLDYDDDLVEAGVGAFPLCNPPTEGTP